MLVTFICNQSPLAVFGCRAPTTTTSGRRRSTTYSRTYTRSSNHWTRTSTTRAYFLTLTQLKYERKDEEWFRFYSHLYIKYVQCYKTLEDCYDQIVHPQKRVLLKEMLESTMLRVVEIKLNLVKYNTATNAVRSEYVNLDEFLLEMRLRPA